MMTQLHPYLFVFLMAIVTVFLGVGCDTLESAPGSPTGALVITTDYQSGSYGFVDPETREVSGNIDIIHNDAVCRYSEVTSSFYIVSRLGGDSIARVDRERGGQIASEFSVGAGSNPQDIAVVSPDRAYVSLMNEPGLLVVNPATGETIETIDLSPFADEDGLPEASGLLLQDDILYVALLLLDNFTPTDSSVILTLDAATGEVLGPIVPTFTNPNGKLRFNEELESIVLVSPGLYGELDGGVELLNIATEEVTSTLALEEDLGGDIDDAVVVSETLGFAILGKLDGGFGHTEFVSFNPQTGALTETLLVSDEWAYASVEYLPSRNEVWLTDRTMDTPGVRIFDGTTGEELTSGPIDVALPPFQICFATDEGSDDA